MSGLFNKKEYITVGSFILLVGVFSDVLGLISFILEYIGIYWILGACVFIFLCVIITLIILRVIKDSSAIKTLEAEVKELSYLHRNADYKRNGYEWGVTLSGEVYKEDFNLEITPLKELEEIILCKDYHPSITQKKQTKEFIDSISNYNGNYTPYYKSSEGSSVVYYSKFEPELSSNCNYRIKFKQTKRKLEALRAENSQSKFSKEGALVLTYKSTIPTDEVILRVELEPGVIPTGLKCLKGNNVAVTFPDKQDFIFDEVEKVKCTRSMSAGSSVQNIIECNIKRPKLGLDYHLCWIV